MAKGLLEKLRQAGRFCEAGNFNGENEALTLYREVIGQLSPAIRHASPLLGEAETDYKNGNLTHSLQKYKKSLTMPLRIWNRNRQ